MDGSPIIKTRHLGFTWETRGPFLFCVHHLDKYPKGNKNLGPAESLKGRNIGHDFDTSNPWRMYHGDTIPGFPAHPHRGFETITVVLEGMVDHSDSHGASGRYGNGDVQWMTAGAGLQHAEMFPLLKEDEENHLELFQIWLNLPKSKKFCNPFYKMLWNEEIPKPVFSDNSGKETEVTIIAGKLKEISAPLPAPDSWAADSVNETAIMIINMQPGAEWTLPQASAGLSRSLYYYRGTGLKVSGKIIPEYHAVDLLSDHKIDIKAGESGASVLLLQSRPINEPVVQHGPFVMNTYDEILKAFSDYKETEFGGWPWPDYDNVHPKTMGRFARYSDGMEEIKL